MMSCAASRDRASSVPVNRRSFPQVHPARLEPPGAASDTLASNRRRPPGSPQREVRGTFAAPPAPRRNPLDLQGGRVFAAPSTSGSTAPNTKQWIRPRRVCPADTERGQTRMLCRCDCRVRFCADFSPMRSNVASCACSRSNRSAGVLTQSRSTKCQRAVASLEYRARGDCEMLISSAAAPRRSAPVQGQPLIFFSNPGSAYRTIPRATRQQGRARGAPPPFGYHPQGGGDLRFVSHPRPADHHRSPTRTSLRANSPSLRGRCDGTRGEHGCSSATGVRAPVAT